jgi:hypothetical protein
MTRTLHEYDVQVGQHLHEIIEGAAKIKSHVLQMVYQPHFDTLAFEEIENIERLLCNALEKVRYAKAAYRGLPRDPSTY